jgi:light-harvesting complex II chlorophyll a/b binding protein 5
MMKTGFQSLLFSKTHLAPLYVSVKEIKNGRLAMIAMLGVFVQGAVTAEGPAANWGKHVANPFGYNFITLTALDRTPTL